MRHPQKNPYPEFAVEGGLCAQCHEVSMSLRTSAQDFRGNLLRFRGFPRKSCALTRNNKVSRLHAIACVPPPNMIQDFPECRTDHSLHIHFETVSFVAHVHKHNGTVVFHPSPREDSDTVANGASIKTVSGIPGHFSAYLHPGHLCSCHYLSTKRSRCHNGKCTEHVNADL